MRNQLENIFSAADNGVVGHQFTSKVYVVKTEVSPMSPLGQIHVYKSEIGRIDCGFR